MAIGLHSSASVAVLDQRAEDAAARVAAALAQTEQSLTLMDSFYDEASAYAKKLEQVGERLRG